MAEGENEEKASSGWSTPAMGVIVYGKKSCRRQKKKNLRVNMKRGTNV